MVFQRVLKISTSIVCLSLLLVCCKNKNESNDVEHSGTTEDYAFWKDFYKPNMEKVNVDDNANYTKASFGYYDNDQQGFNNWFYLQEKNGTQSPLSFDGNKKGFSGDGVQIINEVMKGDSASAIRKFAITKSGEVTICGKIATLENTTCEFSIFKNDEKIYPDNGTLSLNNDTQGIYYSIKANVVSGDNLYFKVNGAAKCNPSIIYGEQQEILYHLPSWNFYGDVHPFYHQGKMYMYALEAYLENVGAENIQWHLLTSTDMFNYEEEPMMDYDFLTDHCIHARRIRKDTVTEELYPYGARDACMCFDESIQKWIFTILGYNQDMSSYLTCLVSDDESDKNWSGPRINLIEFPKSHDPECSQIFKIKDRWYILTSEWGNSIHSVGRPQYYIGDAGKDFLAVDWSSKEPHYLDGEDMCAANLCAVDKDKYVIYGWIPKTSYGNNEPVYFDGTRDHGLWGGEINVNREILQNEDGTLTTRLDSRITELLDRGKIYESKTPVINQEFGEFNRSFVQFDADVKEDCRFGYALTTDEGKTYEIRINAKKSGVYMQIYCKEDTGHPLASEMLVGKELMGVHNFKIIIDHSICEFFLDDEYALSARTSLFDGVHRSKLFATGNVEFSNLTISKLANQLDVYD